MKRVFFLVNNLDELFDFSEFVKKYLNETSITVGDSLPQNPNEYDLIILWTYRKIIKNIPVKKNMILFHSSDLPYGKGWAPTYYSISSRQEYYTISGIIADEQVDSGDVIVKARFKIKDNHTAQYIRKWDYEICISLIKRILEKFDNREIKGKKQEGIGSTNPRRKPTENEINLNAKFGETVNHLRACEKNHPAFFYYNQTKYLVNIEPESTPDFPNDLEITFYDSTQ